jgi:hypothetical protein
MQGWVEPTPCAAPYSVLGPISRPTLAEAVDIEMEVPA